MAVAAADIVIELTITAQFTDTLMNANVDKAVAVVQIANDLRRPNLV